MKPVRLGDLRELLEAAPFAAWWTDWSRAVAAVAEASARRADVASQAELMELRAELAQRAAVDAFSAAGDAEDEAATLGAEAQRHENRALEIVGRFEEQRVRASELWVRLGGAERALDEKREARAAAAQIRAAEKQHRALREEYAAEDAKRARLWDEVEGAWAASFERALVAAEHGQRSRALRREAERLFAEAEERRVRARQHRAEAEAAARELAEASGRRKALLAQAEARFGALAGEAWLYFRRPDDPRAAWAVALADGAEGAGPRVKALSIHAVGRRGVASLEPAREADPAGGPALDAFLLESRRGRSGGGPPPGSATS